MVHKRTLTRALGPAKLDRPRLERVYPRVRLFRALERARTRPLVWVSAPAGAGKTSLVGSYLAHKREGPIWYQVDAGDADPATFFYYLTAAAKRLQRGIDLPLFTVEYQASLEVYARNYFRRLFGGVRGRRALVLDNYQEVGAESALHEVIRVAAQEAPRGVTIFVASRADPPVAFTRMEASDALARIGWEDIRLSEEETMGIVQLKRDKEPLPTDVIQEIHHYTDGWAAALVLMLERLKNQPLARPIATPSGQADIFHYFADEILERSVPAVQEFLVQTALLDRFSADMAATLTGNAAAWHILRDLVARNYFTVEHTAAVATYEYHPLFQAFLRRRAQEKYGTALPQLLRRASTILAGERQYNRAVALLAEAGHWEGLEELVLANAPSLVAQGRWKTLADWIQLLPASRRETSPEMLYWSGVATLPFDPRGARTALSRAYGQFKDAGDGARQALAWCAVVDSVVFEWGDFRPLDEWIDEIEVELGRRRREYAPALEAQVACGVFMALMSRRPQHPDIGAWAQRAWDLTIGGGDAALRVKAGPHLLLYYTWWIGDLAKAELLLKALRELVEDPNAAPLVQTTWCAMAAAFHWMSAENERCIETVENGLKVARQTGVHAWDMLLCSQAVFAALSSGQDARAEEFLERMARLRHASRPMDNAMYYYLSAWLLHRRGEHAAAREHAKTAVNMAEAAGAVFQAAIFWNDYGRTLFYSGDEAGARDAVHRSLAVGYEIRAKTVEYLCFLVEAEIALRRGDDEACGAALRHSLQVGRQQGFLNHTWWDDATMARLYGHALEAGIEPEYVTSMIRLRRLRPPEPVGAVEQWPWPLKIYTLGRFSVVKDGKPLELEAGSKRKPLELLMALIALGGSGVSQTKLTDALWPEVEGHLAQQTFEVTLHRLRKLIGQEPALVLKDGKLSLDAHHCWVDSWVCEHLLGRIERALHGSPACPDDIDRLAAQLLALYQGPFLATEAEQPWLLSPRERLRSKFLRQFCALGHYWEGDGKWDKAINGYLQGVEVDPLAEEFYRSLMRCYRRQGRPAEACAVYARCRNTLKTVLGVNPSPETETLRRAIDDDQTKRS